MTWKPKRSPPKWRQYLTREERAAIAVGDIILADIEKLRNKSCLRDRAKIINRAIHRAKYAENSK